MYFNAIMIHYVAWGPVCKMVLGSFSLPLSQWVPRHEKSPRSLSAMTPRMTLWPNPIWPPSAILKNSTFLFLTVYARVIPLMLLISVCRIHFWHCFCHSESSLASKVMVRDILLHKRCRIITWLNIAVETGVISLILLISVCRYSFLILFSSFGVIFNFKGQGQGHNLCYINDFLYNLVECSSRNRYNIVNLTDFGM